jgi:uncharacterized protein
MIEIGTKNKLTALRITSVGMFLGDDEGNDVLLPFKYFSVKDLHEGDTVEVFVYKDSEDRVIATNLVPLVERNQFAYLCVKSVSSYGAFLDWGLEKDLLVPFREQNTPLDEGQWTTVFCVLDPTTDRLIGSCKVNRYLEFDDIDLEVMQEVEILVYERSGLGFNVIINDLYRGLVYNNEIFQPLKIGDRLTAYIKNIREDLTIDVVLQRQGYLAVVESATEKVLAQLVANGGFLPIGDHSEPAVIYAQFEMSKKNFKKAIGTLYRERKILIQPSGISLIASPQEAAKTD